MNTTIKQHRNFILKKLKSINGSGIDKSIVKRNLKDLEKFNRAMTINFQHERQIHLLVTLFFGLIVIIFAISAFILGWVASTNYNFVTVFYLSMAILLILLITEIFYIFHYFKLENGTQSLYILSYDIFQSIDSLS